MVFTSRMVILEIHINKAKLIFHNIEAGCENTKGHTFKLIVYMYFHDKYHFEGKLPIPSITTECPIKNMLVASHNSSPTAIFLGAVAPPDLPMSVSLSATKSQNPTD